jgi:hypothetical protein
VPRYPRRFWNDYRYRIDIADEDTAIDPVLLPEDEWRRFLLWRLGLAEPRQRLVTREEVLREIAVQMVERDRRRLAQAQSGVGELRP